MIITNGCFILVHIDSSSPVADPENFGEGMIKIFNTKPKNIGGVIPGTKPKIRNGAAVLGVRSADPPALKNFAFFYKNNLILELV